MGISAVSALRGVPLAQPSNVSLGLEPGDDPCPRDGLAEKSPVFAGIVTASIQGRVALAPRGRARAPPRAGAGSRRSDIPRASAGTRRGFRSHASVWVSANDRASREPLGRYVLRPPPASGYTAPGLGRASDDRPEASTTASPGHRGGEPGLPPYQPLGVPRRAALACRPATDQDRGRWPSHAARRRMPRTCTPKAFASLGSPRWRAAQTARTTAGSICVSAGCRDERLTRPGATQRETESRLKVRA
jgi:hypothetical protein